jgi:hypothetical protein
MEDLRNQVQEINEAISCNNNEVNIREYTHQNFINIARTLIQDKPGVGQRKPGMETSELLDKLEARSEKVKSIISYLDKNLNTREYNSSYVE